METLTFSLIQTPLVWEDATANLTQLEKLIQPLAGKTQIIVLPEMFNTGFTMQPQLLAETMHGPTLQWMQYWSKKTNTIITGSLAIEENQHFYNRLIWMQPNGRFGYYDKRHLFGFAGEHDHYTAGQKRLIAQVGGWKINLQICYDLRFPVWSRQQPTNHQPEYDILLYVANWPESRAHAWKTLLTARAIENQCYVIGVNRVGNDGKAIAHSGDSCIIDPLGAIIAAAPPHQSAIITQTLSIKTLHAVRQQFPFLKDADSFLLNHA